MKLDDFTTVRVEELDDRMVVSLHRPAVRNAIDQRMVDELHEVCAYLEGNPKILILTGLATEDAADGKAVFASGADIGELRDRRRDSGLLGINATIFRRLAHLPMPVIAALDGFTLGGGAELAYAADFRIGTPRVRLGNPEPGLGIMAAAGGTWRLAELVGEPVAKEVLLAGRILTGAECREYHLLNDLVEPEDLLPRAHDWADRIGKSDPFAVRVTKTVFRMPREAHPEVDMIAQALLFESEQKFERMDAFLERRSSRR
jgi:enoyl-CoA hydratase